MQLIIEEKAACQLKYFTELASDEISGMGKTSISEDKIYLEEIVIFKQTCSAGSTEIDDDAIAKFIYQLQKNDEDTAVWNLWWHSHADMEVFWSGTDNATITDHAGGQSFLISLVVNKKGERKARLDVFPKDNSPFNIPTSCMQDIKEISLQLSDTKEKQKTKLEKIISKAITELDALETFSSTAVKNFCQKEIDAKVTAHVVKGFVSDPDYVSPWKWDKEKQEYIYNGNDDPWNEDGVYEDWENEYYLAAQRRKPWNKRKKHLPTN